MDVVFSSTCRGGGGEDGIEFGLGCMGGGDVVGAAVEGKRSARLAVHAASVTKAKRLQKPSGYKSQACSYT